MKVSCIVASAGSGKRLGKGIDKPFVKIKKKPILSHTLKALTNLRIFNEIIVVVAPGKVAKCNALIKQYKFSKVASVVKGGKRRFDSVRNGLKHIKDADFVFIHDGARPFIEKSLIEKVFKAAKKYGAALPAMPIKQTAKLITKNFFIKSTPDRKFLYEAQTPQAFKRNLILKAYEVGKKHLVTDDSSLVEILGHKVKIVKGSHKNIKITTKEDLILAEGLIK